MTYASLFAIVNLLALSVSGQPPKTTVAAVVPSNVPAILDTKPLKSETLHYSISWPSGLSLGEGTLTSALTGDEWKFTVALQASLPGFSLEETADSKASTGFCSAQLNKQWTRGKKKGQETTDFDAVKLSAKRKTKGGGESDVVISNCGRDALAYLFFARRELAQGRIPNSQSVLYGAPYQATLQYKGSQPVRLGADTVEAEHLDATIKGPASEFVVEMYFAKDPVRTPVMIRVPSVLGKFTLELVR
jgi:hypothetical protein